MLLKTQFIVDSNVAIAEKTIIKFHDNFAFTVNPKLIESDNYNVEITDIKGDFEVIMVKAANVTKEVNVVENAFVIYTKSSHARYTFYILANIEFKIINHVIVPYQLQISVARFNLLKPHECYVQSIILPGYDYIMFTTYIKRISSNGFQVLIENPYKVNMRTVGYIKNTKRIFTNKQRDLCLEITAEWSSFEGINTTISFIFDPNVVKRQISSVQNTNTRPSLTPQMKNLHIYEIKSNIEYFDVVLISSDNVQIPCHRCVLAKHSEAFGKKFKEATKLPVKITVQHFDAKLVSSIVDWIYNKHDINANDENKLNVSKFVSNYDIKCLTETLCLTFVEPVNALNVCDVIKIALLNGDKDLKQKCLTVLSQNRKDIGTEKIKELPKDIVVEAFCT